MYKLQNTKTKKFEKSYSLIDICNYIIKNPSLDYQFFEGYTPYTKNGFFKKILLETKNFDLFYNVYISTNKVKNLKEYVNEKNEKLD